MDRRLWRAPLVVVLVGLMMTAVMWQWVGQAASARAEARLEDELDRASSWVGGVLSVLRRDLDEAERTTRGRPLLAQSDYEARLQPLLDTGAVPGLAAVFFVKPVPADDVFELVAEERSAGLHDFAARIWPRQTDAPQRWLAIRQATVSTTGWPRADGSGAGERVPVLEGRVWDLYGDLPVRRALAAARQDDDVARTAVVPASTFAVGPAAAHLEGDLWLVSRWAAPAQGWVVGVLDPRALLARLPGPLTADAVLLANAAPEDFEAVGSLAWRELGVPDSSAPPGSLPFAIAATGLVADASATSARTVVVSCLLLTALSAVTVAVVGWSQRHVAASRSRSRIDELTGLANRAAAEGELARLVAEGHRPAVLFADIDRFKLINDALGHQAGDEVLQAVGRALELVSPYGALPARWGGDEFVVVCPAGDEQARATAERLLEVVGGPVAVTGGEVAVGVSVGLAAASLAGTPGAALAAADAAMYEAKRRGGARVTVAGEGRAGADHALHQVLAAHALAVDLELVRGCSMAGPVGDVVALVARPRWPDAPGGPLAGMELADLAVRLDLGLALVDELLRGLHPPPWGWPAWEPGDEPRLLLPLPDAVVLDPNLAQLLARWLHWRAMAPGSVAVGVSERVLAGAGAGALALHDLRATGVHVHLEGFNGRVATLAALVAAAPVGVALEPLTTTGPGGLDRSAAGLVRAAAAWTAAAGVPLTATGVASLEEAAVLASLGVTRLRGPAAGAPVPVDAWGAPQPLGG